jgi:GTPase involved in cell partitioning and DNA repair
MVGVISVKIDNISFFVVVATVLGTGILALPVKVGETGFGPFVLNFFICFIAQALVLIYMVELLQKTSALQMTQQVEQPTRDESLAPLQEELQDQHELTVTNTDERTAQDEEEPMEEIQLETKTKTIKKINQLTTQQQTSKKY